MAEWGWIELDESTDPPRMRITPKGLQEQLRKLSDDPLAKAEFIAGLTPEGKANFARDTGLAN